MNGHNGQGAIPQLPVDIIHQHQDARSPADIACTVQLTLCVMTCVVVHKPAAQAVTLPAAQTYTVLPCKNSSGLSVNKLSRSHSRRNPRSSCKFLLRIQIVRNSGTCLQPRTLPRSWILGLRLRKRLLGYQKEFQVRRCQKQSPLMSRARYRL